MTPTRLLILLLAPLALGLTSCGTMKSVGAATASGVKSMGSATASGVGKVSSGVSGGFRKVSDGMGSVAGNVGDFAKNTKSAILPERVPVVEAREEELKDYETGREKALAYQKQRRQRFWFFGGPVEFDEPALPEVAESSDDLSLLPPKAE